MGDDFRALAAVPKEEADVSRIEDASGEDARLEILKRQVETKAKLHGQNTSAAQLVAFSKLIECATPGEKALMYVGWLFAFLTGIGLPLFAQFLQKIFNSFGPEVTPKETLRRVQTMFFVMIGVGVGIGLFGFVYWFILLRFSNKISRRTKENYLAAILKQETGWFDSFNYNELSARITKETMAINKAIGEKVGLIIFSLGMTICGLVIGVINGWSLALANFAVGPVIGLCAVFFGNTMQNKFSKALKAYGQSAGYAEQALSAIKVVVAFGMEPTEIKNYSKYLSRSKDMGRKQQILLALSIGFFIGSIFCSYSYAFWVGGIWIEKRYWNHILDRAYMGGDILAVFWGILFGFFALSQVSPHAKNVSEG